MKPQVEGTTGREGGAAPAPGAMGDEVRVGTVIVAEQKVYNRRVFKPLNETAKLFAELVGQKNLTPENLVVIHRLGYQIEAEAPKLADILGGESE